MKKRYDETNGEIVFEDVSMAAALTGKHYHQDGTEHQGLEFLRVQDTPFSDTKEVVLEKNEETEDLIQLYLNKKLRIEPHDYLNRIGELKDLIKARIKQTGSHYIEERKQGGEDADA